MKIAILTQPLHTNYGGTLQNYALQQVLKREGHTPITLDITRINRVSFLRRTLSWGKRLICHYILGQDVVSLNFTRQIPQNDSKYIAQHHARFINENISKTKQIATKIDITHFDSNIDAFIVGSDQIWRPKYNPFIEENFLSFIPINSSIRRIAYAASFGTDEKEFSNEQIRLCSPFARRLHAISVRENSGVALCRAYFDVSAQRVLDPTMLLCADDYLSSLSISSGVNSDFLFCYLLDSVASKTEIASNVASVLGLDCKYIMPRPYSVRACIDDCISPPPEEWIQGFANSSFVITDSFHGTVFSILFNRPFISINNPRRGSDRFISLLNLFGLRHRMVSSVTEITSDLLDERIDWTKINEILERERELSLKFLRDALTIQ